MCAIYGTTNLQYDQQAIGAKLGSMCSRGPEHSGRLQIDKVLFGHNRLAIIDLDIRSNQPFHYKGIYITFNGEIYNYQELRNRLTVKGYTFKTNSDTEVLCATYLEYGVECLKEINGMYAFVIYDTKQQILFGARDRLGKKPLYYSLANNLIEFASSLKALMIGQKYTVDEDAVNDYLFWGYFPEPDTIVKEVKKLKAGHYFLYQLNSGDFRETQYWSILNTERGSFKGSYDDAKKELSDLLSDAVKLRMIADVPLGIFLSGGVDSSLILAMAARNSSKPIQSFSISFKEKGYDESIYAEKIAAYFGARQTTVQCDIQDGLNYMMKFVEYVDEPLDDFAIIPGLLIAKEARQHLTVALTGDGGDEAFIGYERYRWMNKVKTLYSLPPIIRKSVAKILSKSPNYRIRTIANGLEKEDLPTLYKHMMGSMKTDWFEFKGRSMARFPGVLNAKNGIISNVSDYDILTYLNDDINVKVDRSAMASSLETRAPLMDYRIFEFAKSIPLDYAMQNGTHKRILKDLLKEHIPQSYFNRPKSGFSVPVKEWFRHELKSFVLDSLTAKRLSVIPGVKSEAVLKMVNAHIAGDANFSRPIWRLIILQQWMQRFSQNIHSA